MICEACGGGTYQIETSFGIARRLIRDTDSFCNFIFRSQEAATNSPFQVQAGLLDDALKDWCRDFRKLGCTYLPGKRNFWVYANEMDGFGTLEWFRGTSDSTLNDCCHHFFLPNAGFMDGVRYKDAVGHGVLTPYKYYPDTGYRIVHGGAVRLIGQGWADCSGDGYLEETSNTVSMCEPQSVSELCFDVMLNDTSRNSVIASQWYPSGARRHWQLMWKASEQRFLLIVCHDGDSDHAMTATSPQMAEPSQVRRIRIYWDRGCFGIDGTYVSWDGFTSAGSGLQPLRIGLGGEGTDFITVDGSVRFIGMWRRRLLTGEVLELEKSNRGYPFGV
jgi:hypothetical protein